MNRAHRDGRCPIFPEWAGGGLIALVAAIFVVGNTGWREPPRFDGAGYVLLADALRSGQGYRSVDQPDRPAHVHYPPAYPIALAIIRSMTGPSVPALHAFSVLCALSGILVSWLWLRTQVPSTIAWLLGLALAVNWFWTRNAGEILSESMFLLIQMIVMFCTQIRFQAGKGPGSWADLALGAGIGLAVLTRHVGVVLVLVIGLEFLMRRLWKELGIVIAVAVIFVAPWVFWLGIHPARNQLDHFAEQNRLEVLLNNALFYLRRLPDMLAGPMVEVATVFDPRFAVPATIAASLVSGAIVWGWLSELNCPRTRPGAVLSLSSMTLLCFWPYTEAGRFLIPLLPFILRGAHSALTTILDRARVRTASTWAATLLLLVAIPYSSYALLSHKAAMSRARFQPFDAACAWIAAQPDRPGTVLTDYPGEVFLQTGRRGIVLPSEIDFEGIDRLIDQWGVVYLVVNSDRFARAPENPLIPYLQARPEYALVYGDPATTAVYEVP